MHQAFRNHGALPRTKLHRAALEIEQQFSLDHVEKFVIVVMLMPVIFTGTLKTKGPNCRVRRYRLERRGVRP